MAYVGITSAKNLNMDLKWQFLASIIHLVLVTKRDALLFSINNCFWSRIEQAFDDQYSIMVLYLYSFYLQQKKVSSSMDLLFQ